MRAITSPASRNYEDPKACADEDMRATMKRGAIYEYQYLDRRSRLHDSFDIRNADCDAPEG